MRSRSRDCESSRTSHTAARPVLPSQLSNGMPKPCFLLRATWAGNRKAASFRKRVLLFTSEYFHFVESLEENLRIRLDSRGTLTSRPCAELIISTFRR